MYIEYGYNCLKFGIAFEFSVGDRYGAIVYVLCWPIDRVVGPKGESGEFFMCLKYIC